MKSIDEIKENSITIDDLKKCRKMELTKDSNVSMRERIFVPTSNNKSSMKKWVQSSPLFKNTNEDEIDR